MVSTATYANRFLVAQYKLEHNYQVLALGAWACTFQFCFKFRHNCMA